MTDERAPHAAGANPGTTDPEGPEGEAGDAGDAERRRDDVRSDEAATPVGTAPTPADLIPSRGAVETSPHESASAESAHAESVTAESVNGESVNGDETGTEATTPTPPTTSTSSPPAHDPVAPTAMPAVAPAESDPSRWGRVDDDGTVWVREDGDERAVGSWQAGDVEEGLRHFARRFDDLRTEVELLVSRLGSGRGDAKTIGRSAGALRERLVDAAAVGDLAGLRCRLDAVVANAEQAGEQERAAKAGARDEAVARKEALIAEAETLAEETTRWKHAGDRFSAMLDEWKTIKGIERRTDDALWKRFSRARETFTRRRGAHFAELDRARTAAKTRKEELVGEAEHLVDSTDWGPTAARYKELMAEWKAAGRTTKEADDALWVRFRGAQDTFFAARSAALSERDAEFTENARAKEALLAEAGRIDPSDVETARAALRDLQERWDAVGKVPRERVREFSQRLKEVEDRVRTALDRRWQRNDPETEARIDQFRSRVEQYESQAAKAHAAGDRRRAHEAERQAAQWREWLATAERSGG